MPTAMKQAIEAMHTTVLNYSFVTDMILASSKTYAQKPYPKELTAKQLSGFRCQIYPK